MYSCHLVIKVKNKKKNFNESNIAIVSKKQLLVLLPCIGDIDSFVLIISIQFS